MDISGPQSIDRWARAGRHERFLKKWKYQKISIFWENENSFFLSQNIKIKLRILFDDKDMNINIRFLDLFIKSINFICGNSAPTASAVH